MRSAFMLVFSLFSLQCVSLAPQDTLVVGWDMDELITLDPAESFELAGNELIYNMYQRLLKHDPRNKGKFLGEIAESWTVDNKNKRHIFKIKKGLKFSSGNPVTAHDVAFSLQRLAKLNKSPSGILRTFGPSWTAEKIDHVVRAVSNDELHLVMEEEVAPTLIYNILSASSGSVIDKKMALENNAEDYGHKWLRTHSAGSGPYQLKKWTPQQLLILIRNDEYTPKPQISKLFFRNVREAGTQVLLLRKGDIDVAKNIGLNDIEAIQDASPIFLETANLRVLHLNQKNEILRNPKVRQALRHLIDYDGIAQNIKRGTFMVHNSFVPSHFPCSITGKQFDFNIEKAKKLLKEAGYPDGFTITLSAVSPEIPQKIKEDFSKAGVLVDIHLGDSKQVLTKLRGRTHDMALAMWGADFYDPDANASTFMRNPNNDDDSTEKTLAWRNAWEIPDLTKTTDEAKKIEDADSRSRAYQKLQEKFLKDAPMIVMFQTTNILGVLNKVHGLYMAPSMSTVLYENVQKH